MNMIAEETGLEEQEISTISDKYPQQNESYSAWWTDRNNSERLLAWCESREKVQTETHVLCPPEQHLARSASALRQSQWTSHCWLN